MLATIRSRFWIAHRGAAVKSVIEKCRRCHNYLVIVNKQTMALLIAISTQQGWFPLQFVGTDYFGSLLVRHSSKIEKRYGCLCARLQMFAVRLKFSHFLTTDSFIMTLLWFMPRRGAPSEIFSDNGTNFVGAQHELRSLVKNWSADRISDRLVQIGMHSNFNRLTLVTAEKYGRA